MKTRTAVVALSMVVTLAGATALPAHATRRYVATYVPGVWVGCAPRVVAEWWVGAVVDPSPLPCVGAVTFVPVSHRDTAVRLRIDDATGGRIGGVLRFHDQDGNTMYVRDGAGNVRQQVAFCGRVANAVPAGSARVSVTLHGDACGPSGGTATTGKVVADFT